MRPHAGEVHVSPPAAMPDLAAIPIEPAFAALGLLGAGLYLVAYASLQVGVMDGNSPGYALLNLVAALFVAVSLSTAFNAGSAVTQASMIAFSVYGLVRITRMRRRQRLTEDEAVVAAALVPGLAPVLQRRVLDAARWTDGAEGERLTRQGRPNDRLVFLREGAAEVCVDGVRVGRCEPGALIGEATLLDASAAMATVRLTAPSQLVTFDAARLRRLATQEDAIARALQTAGVAALRAKLAAANAAPGTRDPIAA